jgi:hypothetical protein
MQEFKEENTVSSGSMNIQLSMFLIRRYDFENQS